MKMKFNWLAVVSVALLAAQTGLSDTTIPIGPKFSPGEADYENGFFFVVGTDGLTGAMRDARKQAQDNAKENAIDAFKTACSNRGGEPTKVTAYPAASGCTYVFSGRQGTFHCSAKATGTCTLLAKSPSKASDRVVERPDSPKEIVIDGKVYVEKAPAEAASAPAAK